MNQIAAGVSTFRTSLSGKLVPLDVPTAMSPEEELIAQEERADRERKIEIAGPTIRLLKQISARAKASIPDVCHCRAGKQGCHLHIHDASNGRIITRSAVYCTSC